MEGLEDDWQEHYCKWFDTSQRNRSLYPLLHVSHRLLTLLKLLKRIPRVDGKLVACWRDGNALLRSCE